MGLQYHLGMLDYFIICLSLLISAAIGIASRFCGHRQKTAQEFMLAGKKMSKLPVMLSIVVTLVSPSSMISTPAEIYKYGLTLLMQGVTLPLGIFLASWIFVPVYFQTGVSTVNEFLELRFGKIIKYTISALLLLQMIFYMSVALIGAVLSLSAVTDISVGMSIVSLGTICVIYCSVGGLKAVLWTDTFQTMLMLFCIFSMYAAGIGDAGGILNFLKESNEGSRLKINFEMDMTKRFTFVSCLMAGLVYGLSFYGTSQVQVQRILSLSDAKKAKSTLQLSTFPIVLIYSLCAVFGLVLYSIHYQCDPILDKEQTGLSRYDQMVPAYIVSKFSSIPGMTGLCIAGIFSASLSTISSALNSASTVTVIDFIKPLCKNGFLSDSKTLWLAKIMSIFYGTACIGLSFCFLDLKSLMHIATVTTTTIQGPILAVFLVGVLTRKATDKCVSFGLITGNIATSWIAFGSLFSHYTEPPLPLTTNMCNVYNMTNYMNTSSSFPNTFPTHLPSNVQTEEIFFLYKISFVWHNVIGLFLTLFLIFSAVLITGWKRNVIPPDSKCLSPVVRYWIKPKKDVSEPGSFKYRYEYNDSAVSLSLQSGFEQFNANLFN